MLILRPEGVPQNQLVRIDIEIRCLKYKFGT